jgi:CO dehydrogenase maturation factor
MKVAISGKGGVGKSTLAACMAMTLVKKGKTVCALDADPDANLASALGMPQEVKDSIRPIAYEKALIEERTGAKFGKAGQMFNLSPDVSDVASRYGVPWEGLSLVVLGAVRKGGSGCACPENTFLRALVRQLVLHEGECLVIDMEPGVEHLGRATAAGVDAMVVVLEPGTRSRESGRRIMALSADIGLDGKLFFVLNKMRKGVEPRELLPDNAQASSIAGEIPFDERFLEADRTGVSVLSMPGAGDLAARFATITDELTRRIHGD